MNPNILYALLAAMTAFDTGTTLVGLNRGFREGNPLMAPIVKAGPVPFAATQAGLSAITALASHKLRQEHFKLWWLPMALGIASHGIGGTLNLHRLSQPR